MRKADFFVRASVIINGSLSYVWEPLTRQGFLISEKIDLHRPVEYEGFFILIGKSDEGGEVKNHYILKPKNGGKFAVNDPTEVRLTMCNDELELKPSGEWEEEAQLTDQNYLPNVEIVKKPVSVEVALLFDATMDCLPDITLIDADTPVTFKRGERFAKAIGLTRQIIASLDPLTRYSLVLFGEYPLTVHRINNFDIPGEPKWEVKNLTPNGFVDKSRLEHLLSEFASGETDCVDGGDMEDALEKGIAEVNKISWQSENRILIVVSDSPPHPAEQDDIYQSQHYYIFRSDIDWKDEVAKLEGKGVNIVSVYGDNINLGEERNQFLEVWKRLGRTGGIFEIDKEQDASKIIEQVNKAIKHDYICDAPIPYPFIRPTAPFMKKRGL